MLNEDGDPIEPGSGQIGLVARSGRLPLGYYKDPDKSAATFQLIDGERYSIPGDYATVEADGTVSLKGRGSQCINTGGEKVYPEEVEEALKLHLTVHDAAVVGLPDEKWGQAITALVELETGAVLDDHIADQPSVRPTPVHRRDRLPHRLMRRQRHLERRVPGERAPSRDHFVEGDAERIHITSRTRRAADETLR